MLDENIWLQLNESEKISELQRYLTELLAIEKGNHELSNTVQQGKLVTIRAELEHKIFKIIELENAI